MPFLIVVFIYNHSEAHESCKFSACEYELMNYQYSPAIMHPNICSTSYSRRTSSIDMRNIMLFRLYNHSSSSYSSTRGTFWDGYIIYVRIWKNEISILNFYYAFDLTRALDLWWGILCWFGFIIIAHRRFHLRQ